MSREQTSNLILMNSLFCNCDPLWKTLFQHHTLANSASPADPPGKSSANWRFSTMADQTPSNMNSDEHKQTLPALLTLKPFDVLLGRGRTHLHHPGNMRMKALVRAARPRYNKAGITRMQKTSITQEIVHAIKTSGDQPGRFLMHDAGAGGWTQVDDEVARIKVGNAIRYKEKPESGSQAVSEWMQSSRRRMGTSHDEVEVPSETARRISLPQEQQVERNNPLLSDEEILAELGYDMVSSPKSIVEN
jgi:hypothetical protein